jgi:hypothetical protein
MVVVLPSTPPKPNPNKTKTVLELTAFTTGSGMHFSPQHQRHHPLQSAERAAHAWLSERGAALRASALRPALDAIHAFAAARFPQQQQQRGSGAAGSGAAAATTAGGANTTAAVPTNPQHQNQDPSAVPTVLLSTGAGGDHSDPYPALLNYLRLERGHPAALLQGRDLAGAPAALQAALRQLLRAPAPVGDALAVEAWWADEQAWHRRWAEGGKGVGGRKGGGRAAAAAGNDDDDDATAGPSSDQPQQDQPAAASGPQPPQERRQLRARPDSAATGGNHNVATISSHSTAQQQQAAAAAALIGTHAQAQGSRPRPRHPPRAPVIIVQDAERCDPAVLQDLVETLAQLRQRGRRGGGGGGGGDASSSSGVPFVLVLGFSPPHALFRELLPNSVGRRIAQLPIALLPAPRALLRRAVRALLLPTPVGGAGKQDDDGEDPDNNNDPFSLLYTHAGPPPVVLGPETAAWALVERFDDADAGGSAAAALEACLHAAREEHCAAQPLAALAPAVGRADRAQLRRAIGALTAAQLRRCYEALCEGGVELGVGEEEAGGEEQPAAAAATTTTGGRKRGAAAAAAPPPPPPPQDARRTANNNRARDQRPSSPSLSASPSLAHAAAALEAALWEHCVRPYCAWRLSLLALSRAAAASGASAADSGLDLPALYAAASFSAFCGGAVGGSVGEGAPVRRVLGRVCGAAAGAERARRGAPVATASNATTVAALPADACAALVKELLGLVGGVVGGGGSAATAALAGVADFAALASGLEALRRVLAGEDEGDEVADEEEEEPQQPVTSKAGKRAAAAAPAPAAAPPPPPRTSRPAAPNARTARLQAIVSATATTGALDANDQQEQQPQQHHNQRPTNDNQNNSLSAALRRAARDRSLPPAVRLAALLEAHLPALMADWPSPSTQLARNARRAVLFDDAAALVAGCAPAPRAALHAALLSGRASGRQGGAPAAYALLHAHCTQAAQAGAGTVTAGGHAPLLVAEWFARYAALKGLAPGEGGGDGDEGGEEDDDVSGRRGGGGGVNAADRRAGRGKRSRGWEEARQQRAAATTTTTTPQRNNHRQGRAAAAAAAAASSSPPAGPRFRADLDPEEVLEAAAEFSQAVAELQLVGVWRPVKRRRLPAVQRTFWPEGGGGAAGSGAGGGGGAACDPLPPPGVDLREAMGRALVAHDSGGAGAGGRKSRGGGGAGRRARR